MRRDDERLADIIEAASCLSDHVTSDHPQVPWRQIIAMRNRVVHGYFEVDLDILWYVVTVDVPQLSEHVSAILAESQHGQN